MYQLLFWKTEKIDEYFTPLIIFAAEVSFLGCSPRTPRSNKDDNWISWHPGAQNNWVVERVGTQFSRWLQSCDCRRGADMDSWEWLLVQLASKVGAPKAKDAGIAIVFQSERWQAANIPGATPKTNLWAPPHYRVTRQNFCFTTFATEFVSPLANVESVKMTLNALPICLCRKSTTVPSRCSNAPFVLRAQRVIEADRIARLLEGKKQNAAILANNVLIIG